MLDTGLRSRNAGARHFAWSWSGNQIKNRKPKPELRLKFRTLAGANTTSGVAPGPFLDTNCFANLTELDLIYLKQCSSSHTRRDCYQLR